MPRKNRIRPVSIILFSVGFFLHIICPSRTLALLLTTPFLISINALVLFYSFDENNKKLQTVIFVLFSFVFTIAVEIAGTKTGLIFGNYTYGDTIWLKLMTVPLVIGLNWVTLLLAAYNVAVKISERLKIRSGYWIVLLSAVLLTFLDYLIEPVAVFLDYWNWENDFIPYQNYIAWFTISLILVSFIQIFKIQIRSKLLVFFYFVMVCYFIALRIFLQPC